MLAWRLNFPPSSPKLRGFALAAGFLLVTAAAASPNQLFRDWKRGGEQPILSPAGSTWESAGTFNPAVVKRADQFVMLYRAQDATGTSRLGYAESTDGI